jgi:hypothetical protein
LPSSLMIVSSNAFVFSTSLLVLVFRYGMLIVLMKNFHLIQKIIYMPFPEHCTQMVTLANKNLHT